jgi:hypothetical protein
MEIRVKNCCHSDGSRPRFIAQVSDRVLVRLTDYSLQLGEIVAIAGDDQIEIRREDRKEAIVTVNASAVLALFVGD